MLSTGSCLWSCQRSSQWSVSSVLSGTKCPAFRIEGARFMTPRRIPLSVGWRGAFNSPERFECEKLCIVHLLALVGAAPATSLWRDCKFNSSSGKLDKAASSLRRRCMFFMSGPMMLFQIPFAWDVAIDGRLLLWYVLFTEVIKICKVFPVPHFVLLPQPLLAFFVGS